jgi:hypothetical protein
MRIVVNNMHLISSLNFLHVLLEVPIPQHGREHPWQRESRSQEILPTTKEVKIKFFLNTRSETNCH